MTPAEIQAEYDGLKAIEVANLQTVFPDKHRSRLMALIEALMQENACLKSEIEDLHCK